MGVLLIKHLQKMLWNQTQSLERQIGLGNDQNMPLQNMLFWHNDYFKLKTSEIQQMQQKKKEKILQKASLSN